MIGLPNVRPALDGQNSEHAVEAIQWSYLTAFADSCDKIGLHEMADNLRRYYGLPNGAEAAN